jgi:hypothetical protein
LAIRKVVLKAEYLVVVFGWMARKDFRSKFAVFETGVTGDVNGEQRPWSWDICEQGGKGKKTLQIADGSLPFNFPHGKSSVALWTDCRVGRRVPFIREQSALKSGVYPWSRI